MIGIIGGSGVYELADMADNVEKKTLDTEYGSVEFSLLTIGEKTVVFLSRHAENHSYPPHKINFKANISALKSLGVTQIIATNAVGSLDEGIGPGSIVLTDDFLDFTVHRDRTFFDDVAIHVDMTEPYCNRLRKVILENSDCIDGKVVDGGVHVCTEGPRFETPAEIRMFKLVGGTVVGMTTLPEAVLAREKEMCYSSIAVVSNFCTSISPTKLGVEEIEVIMGEKKEELISLLYNVINNLPESYDCACHHALGDAEF